MRNGMCLYQSDDESGIREECVNVWYGKLYTELEGALPLLKSED